jgi:hypothetical protein
MVRESEFLADLGLTEDEYDDRTLADVLIEQVCLPQRTLAPGPMQNVCIPLCILTSLFMDVSFGKIQPLQSLV